MSRLRYDIQRSRVLGLAISALLALLASGCCGGDTWNISSPGYLEAFPGGTATAEAKVTSNLDLLSHGLTWDFEPGATPEALESWGNTPTSGSLTTTLTITAKSGLPGEAASTFYNGKGFSSTFQISNLLASPVIFNYGRERRPRYHESRSITATVYEIRLSSTTTRVKASYSQGSGVHKRVARIDASLFAEIENDVSGRPYTFEVRPMKLYSVEGSGSNWGNLTEGADDLTITLAPDQQSAKIDVSADFGPVPPSTDAYGSVSLRVEVVARRNDGQTFKRYFQIVKTSPCVFCN